MCKKCPCRNTVKEEESGAVIRGFFRFRVHIDGVFPAVDILCSLYCSPSFLVGKRSTDRVYWGLCPLRGRDTVSLSGSQGKSNCQKRSSFHFHGLQDI